MSTEYHAWGARGVLPLRTEFFGGVSRITSTDEYGVPRWASTEYHIVEITVGNGAKSIAYSHGWTMNGIVPARIEGGRMVKGGGSCYGEEGGRMVQRGGRMVKRGGSRRSRGVVVWWRPSSASVISESDGSQGGLRLPFK